MFFFLTFSFSVDRIVILRLYDLVLNTKALYDL